MKESLPFLLANFLYCPASGGTPVTFKYGRSIPYTEELGTVKQGDLIDIDFQYDVYGYTTPTTVRKVETFRVKHIRQASESKIRLFYVESIYDNKIDSC